MTKHDPAAVNIEEVRIIARVLKWALQEEDEQEQVRQCWNALEGSRAAWACCLDRAGALGIF